MKPVILLSSYIRYSICASSAPYSHFSDSQLVSMSFASKPSSPIAANQSTQSLSLNAPSNDILQVACNGRRFGTPLDLESCRHVLSDIIVYDKRESFAMRYNPAAPSDACQLPYRWLSCEIFHMSFLTCTAISHAHCWTTVNGHCSIQVFLIAPASVANANTRQIKRAAQAVYDKCGRGTPSKGGIANNIGTSRRLSHQDETRTKDDSNTNEGIGGDNNLAVVLAANNYPNVECELKLAPMRLSCAKIVNDIYASPKKEAFGPRETAPDVETPWVIAARRITSFGEAFLLIHC